MIIICEQCTLNGIMGRALDLRSTGRGFKSYSGQKLLNNLGQVVHTHVPLSPWKVTAGLAESNGSLPPGGWLVVTCRLTACTLGSAPGPTLGNKYGKLFAFTFYCTIPDISFIYNRTPHRKTVAFSDDSTLYKYQGTACVSNEQDQPAWIQYKFHPIAASWN